MVGYTSVHCLHGIYSSTCIKRAVKCLSHAVLRHINSFLSRQLCRVVKMLNVPRCATLPPPVTFILRYRRERGGDEGATYRHHYCLNLSRATSLVNQHEYTHFGTQLPIYLLIAFIFALDRLAKRKQGTHVRAGEGASGRGAAEASGIRKRRWCECKRAVVTASGKGGVRFTHMPQRLAPPSPSRPNNTPADNNHVRQRRAVGRELSNSQ